MRHGEEDSDNDQVAIAGGQGDACAARGHRALGPHGLNIMDFCKQFNAKTAKEPDGMIFPVLVTVYTRPHVHFYLEDAAGFDFAAARSGHCEGFSGAEPQQSRQSDEETG